MRETHDAATRASPVAATEPECRQENYAFPPTNSKALQGRPVRSANSMEDPNRTRAIRTGGEEGNEVDSRRHTGYIDDRGPDPGIATGGDDSDDASDRIDECERRHARVGNVDRDPHVRVRGIR